jgi:hypothetical protein
MTLRSITDSLVEGESGDTYTWGYGGAPGATDRTGAPGCHHCSRHQRQRTGPARCAQPPLAGQYRSSHQFPAREPQPGASLSAGHTALELGAAPLEGQGGPRGGPRWGRRQAKKSSRARAQALRPAGTPVRKHKAAAAQQRSIIDCWLAAAKPPRAQPPPPAPELPVEAPAGAGEGAKPPGAKGVDEALPGEGLWQGGQRLKMATINVRGWNSYSSGLDVREMIKAWGDPEVLVPQKPSGQARSTGPRRCTSAAGVP